MYFIRLEGKAILRLNPRLEVFQERILRGAFLLRYDFNRDRASLLVLCRNQNPAPRGLGGIAGFGCG
jgi:hypothetical protein